MSNLKMTEPCVLFYVVDDLNRFYNSFALTLNISSEPTKTELCQLSSLKCSKKIVAFFQADGYSLSVFSNLLKSSEVYSRMVIHNLLTSVPRVCNDALITVKFKLVKPKSEILDYAWNDRMNQLVAERRELEHAMSWLSTLGGAFSALGDNFENCAKIAGNISIQQFKIAFRLCEPPLVARCRVYMALSLIQLGKLSLAKKIIEEQYQYAKNLKDFRLQNMCKGVWAKLQYVYREKKINSKNINCGYLDE